MNQGQKGRPWTVVEKLALCISILEQSGATPDWSSLEPPNGRTIRGTQRVWGEIKREVASAAGTSGIGNTDNENASPVDTASATKPKRDDAPVKKATVAKPKDAAAPTKEKAVRKPRAKNGIKKSGRKRGNGSLETTGQDDEERAPKKSKLSEDGNEEAMADGKGKGSNDGNGEPAGNETGTAGRKKKILGANGQVHHTKMNL